MMKKIIVLLIILIAITCSLSAVDNTIDFTLVLNKNGTDDIWFSNSDNDTARGSSINPVVFPLISTGATSITRVIYFYWIKQSSNSIAIKLSFVADPTDTEHTEGSVTTKDLTGNGYMMRRTGSKIGRNITVTMVDKSNNAIGSVTPTTNEVFTPMPIGSTGDTSSSDRSITFNPETYNSLATLSLTVNQGNVDGSQKWEIESQYEGYIMAEILIRS